MHGGTCSGGGLFSSSRVAHRQPDPSRNVSRVGGTYDSPNTNKQAGRRALPPFTQSQHTKARCWRRLSRLDMGMHTPQVHHSIRSAATTSAVVSNVVVVVV